jgi:hypothetical protein
MVNKLQQIYNNLGNSSTSFYPSNTTASKCTVSLNLNQQHIQGGA